LYIKKATGTNLSTKATKKADIVRTSNLCVISRKRAIVLAFCNISAIPLHSKNEMDPAKLQKEFYGVEVEASKLQKQLLRIQSSYAKA
jgi:hypothetical protein